MRRSRSQSRSATLLCLLLAASSAFVRESVAQETVPDAGPGSSLLPEAETAPAAKPKPRKPAPVKKAPVSPKVPAQADGAVPRPTMMPAAKLPEISVVCDAKAALYTGDKNVSVWVTRSGAIVVDNPLRPLTPEKTQVLQVVVGDKVATAYGPDLFALRRGGTPSALEGILGGPVRWDAELVPLPDALNVVSEAGEALARLAFRECVEAPAVKAAPVAAKVRKPVVAKGKPSDGKPGDGKAREAAGQNADKAPAGLQLPQGAIQ